MAWQIEFDEAALKDLAKLDKHIAKQITTYLRERVAPLKDPRALGKPLRGSELGDFWRYRVGDCRIISHIEDRLLRILVVKVGHRRAVYR